VTRERILCVIVAVVALAVHAGAVAASDEYRQAVRALARGDCDSLAGLVNAGVNAGDRDMHYLAGRMFARGVCVKTDGDRAVRLLETAAKASHGEAARELVRMHGSGRGVAQNYAEAGRWADVWQRSASRPSAPASAASAPAPLTIERSTTMGYLGTIHALATEEILSRRNELARLAPEGVTLRVTLSIPGPALEVDRYSGGRLSEALQEIYERQLRAATDRPCPSTTCTPFTMQVPYAFELK
jgi:hypothetical protein